MIEKSKILLGILLLFFFFLPLGSCEKIDSYSINPPELKQQNEIGNQTIEQTKEYLTPYKILNINEPGTLLFVLAFFWPLPFLFLKNKFKKKQTTKILYNSIEFLLILFSAYCIYGLVLFFWYNATIWGYLSVFVITLYFITFMAEIILFIKKQIKTTA